jgi:hypothetical protein
MIPKSMSSTPIGDGYRFPAFAKPAAYSAEAAASAAKAGSAGQAWSEKIMRKRKVREQKTSARII